MSKHTDDWIAEVLATLSPLVTAQECATTLRTTTRNLRRHIAAGRIRAIRAEESGSSRVLIPRAEVARFLRACAGETAEPSETQEPEAPRPHLALTPDQCRKVRAESGVAPSTLAAWLRDKSGVREVSRLRIEKALRDLRIKP